MKKRIAFSILGLLLVIGALGGLKALQIKDLIAAGESMKLPPTTVTSTIVERNTWEITLQAIGTLEAAQGVVITADLPGRVAKLYFDGGEQVKQGDLLVDQEISTESAQLDAAESDLAQAQRSFNRVSRLFQSKVVSRSEYDTARSQRTAAQAQVDNITASLEKKQITAPFDGRLGLRLVDIGQDLSQGLSIVSLQAFDPMRVNFSLPQKALANVEAGLAVRVTSNAAPNVVFDGDITAMDTEINAANRTVRTQATLQVGADKKMAAASLLPGMFVNVDVVLPDTKDVLMIPITAVSFATFGDSVFILEEDDAGELIARQQFVQLGERRGDFVEVRKGLEVDQQLANDGVFKLRNGATVVRSDVGTKPELAPNPDNS